MGNGVLVARSWIIDVCGFSGISLMRREAEAFLAGRKCVKTDDQNAMHGLRLSRPRVEFILIQFNQRGNMLNRFANSKSGMKIRPSHLNPKDGTSPEMRHMCRTPCLKCRVPSKSRHLSISGRWRTRRLARLLFFSSPSLPLRPTTTPRAGIH